MNQEQASTRVISLKVRLVRQVALLGAPLLLLSSVIWPGFPGDQGTLSVDKPTSVHFTSRQCHHLDAIVSEPSRPILRFAGSLESIGWARCGACVKRTGARPKPTGTDQRFVATVGLETTQ